MITTKTLPLYYDKLKYRNFTPELNLFPIKGINIELGFSGDRISSDGGLLLPRELDKQQGLSGKLITTILKPGHRNKQANSYINYK